MVKIKVLDIVYYYDTRKKEKNSEHFPQAIHKLSLVFHKGMNIPLECDRGVLVPEDFR